MQRVELFLNKERCDINEAKDFRLRISKIVASSNDLSKRGGLYTFTIKIPKTDGNNKILGHINEFTQTGKFELKEKIEAEVYINGEVLLIGNFLISQVTSENYEGVIYGQDISWIDEMEGKDLQDIQSFPSYQFEGVDDSNGYSIQDYKDNLVAGADVDICFPVLGYGNYFDGTWTDGDPLNTISEVTIEELPPAVFEKSVLTYLFQDYNYKVGSSFLFSEIYGIGSVYKNYVLPYTGSDPYPWNWGTLAKWTGVENTADTFYTSKTEFDIICSLFNTGAPGFDVRAKLTQLNNFQIDADYWNDVTHNEYVVRKEGTFDISVPIFNIINSWDNAGLFINGTKDFRNKHTRIIITKNYEAGDLTTEQIVEQAGSTQILANEWVNEAYSNGGTPTTIDYGISQIIANDVNLEVGDTIQVYLVCVEQYTGGGATLYGIRTEWSNYSMSVDIQGQPIEINPALGLPEIGQREFVKGILNRYNLFFQYSADTRTLDFVTRSTFYREPDLFVNLDDSCDIKDFSIVPISIPAKQIYKWADDEADYYLKQDSGFADTEINNTNLYAKGEFKIELPYAPSKEREYSFPLSGGVADLPNIAGEDEIFIPLNEVEKNYDFTPRLLRVVRSEVSAIRFTISGVSVIWFTCLFGNEWTDIDSLGAKGFYSYWQRQGLDKSNLIQGSAWINADQWKKLNDNYNVEIGGDRYKIEEIDAFDPQKRNPTKLTLLKEV